MFIPWGYQIMVMSIDNLILALVIFVLEIIEFAHYKHLALEQGELVGDAKRFLKVGHDVQVRSGVPEDDEDNSMTHLKAGHKYKD
jgi:hypothetical protein